MTLAQIEILTAIIVYLIGKVYVRYYFSKNDGGDSASEFYLGGRKLGPLVTAMRAEASDMSSWLLMGLPGVPYLTGAADAGWTAIGLAFLPLPVRHIIHFIKKPFFENGKFRKNASCFHSSAGQSPFLFAFL